MAIKNKKRKCDITISTLNWNVTNKLQKCIDSFLKFNKDLNYRWYIIDNDSQDMDFNEIIQKYSINKRIKFIKNQKNEGAIAFNKIFEKISGRYFLILGPDTLQIGNSIEELIKFMDNNPIAGMASANQLNPDGTILLYYGSQWSITKIFFLYTTLGRLIDYFLFSNKMLYYYNYSYFNLDSNGLINIYQIPGACMIIRTELLIQDKYIIDPYLPFYFNDVDICKRVWDKGYKIYLVPKAQIIHDHLSSFKKINRSERVKEYHKSLFQFFRKHYKNKLLLLKLLYITNSFISLIEGKIRKNKIEFKESLRDIRSYLKW